MLRSFLTMKTYFKPASRLHREPNVRVACLNLRAEATACIVVKVSAQNQEQRAHSEYLVAEESGALTTVKSVEPRPIRRHWN